jgi:hypothetical protein
VETQAPAPQTSATDWQKQIQDFSIAGKTEGYQKSKAFLEFLNRSLKSDGTAPDTLASRLENSGLWALIGLILIGGLALNLTPCVLPMIPINLAIIGAGARASSRGRGFALGAAYGAGIALTYGILGLAAALTGARFGALNSVPLGSISPSRFSLSSWPSPCSIFSALILQDSEKATPASIALLGSVSLPSFSWEESPPF